MVSWEAAVKLLCRQADKQDLVRACYFDDPLLDAARRFHRSGEWEAVRALLPSPPGAAIEVGAGRGIGSFALAADGWSVAAVEPDPSATVGAGAIRALAHEASAQITVVESIGEELPFSEGAFDVAYCRQTLHHARDLGQLCRELARVLKPGGVFIATREHVLSDVSELPVFLGDHPLHHLYGGEHAYTLAQYKNAIGSAGLALKRTLNPLASEINTFPIAMQDIKRSWASRLGIGWPELIPDGALKLRGHFLNQPGRLYSFVATKPHA